MNWFKAAAFRFLAVIVMTSSAPGAEVYRVRSTAELAWQGKDINEAGELAGGHINALYFDGRSIISIKALEGTNGAAFSVFREINNKKVMVGESTTGPDNKGPRRAIAFDATTGVLRDLGSLNGPTGASVANGINDSNIIVGASEVGAEMHAVRFETNGVITDLGTLGGGWSSASSINERGEIVGQSRNSNGVYRAFYIPVGGKMADLGTLGGEESSAIAINDKGQIVGSAEATNGATHACLFQGGQVIDLESFSESRSYALGINNSGAVVGFSNFGGYQRHAFVYYPGGTMRDLNTMINLPEGDFLFQANGINDQGMIVASVAHPVGRTGVELTKILTPGISTSMVQDNHWQTSINAPAGSVIRLDATSDFLTWQPVLSSPSQETPLTYTEPLASGGRFFRLSIQSP